ncbi:ribbon-helix-helix domain-containing protein [Rhizobium tubonense]|uniref:Type II toxin-antitoxin system ParD family antitoxin n=1 Tax=Rhizobium tubonense TaxID=484088 RepID=A0A2W4EKD5_9HYPH|nr:type II toxin-antitoxin system ParD family antitoxin [Rhizobium tubonense]PZM14346.1 type II toxin-antitoxin system ParD family antitoxin [Rhizobium tubonense]
MRSRSITLTLGKQQSSIDARLESGEFESASEVVRAALRALDREKEILDDAMRAKLREAMDDPRPSIPAAKVFAQLRAFHEDQVKADKRGA